MFFYTALTISSSRQSVLGEHFIRSNTETFLVSINTQHAERTIWPNLWQFRNTSVPSSQFCLFLTPSHFYTEKWIQFHASGRRFINGKISISCSNKSVQHKNSLLKLLLPLTTKIAFYGRKYKCKRDMCLIISIMSSSGRYKLAEAGGRSERIIILAYLESQETEWSPPHVVHLSDCP